MSDFKYSDMKAPGYEAGLTLKEISKFGCELVVGALYLLFLIFAFQLSFTSVYLYKYYLYCGER